VSNLKECPFCGGEADIDTTEYGGTAKWVNNIYCSECGVSMSNLYGPKKNAINRWNKRYTPIKSVKKNKKKDMNFS
jgi:Lar family restriction alleviation protein